MRSIRYPLATDDVYARWGVVLLHAYSTRMPPSIAIGVWSPKSALTALGSNDARDRTVTRRSSRSRAARRLQAHHCRR